MPTIADLYREAKAGFHDPSYRGLIATLMMSGPVVLDGAILAGRVEGAHWSLIVNRAPALDQFARVEIGELNCYDESRIPPDEELSRLWGIPLAKDVEVGPDPQERHETWRDRPSLL
jgi:hypothetical protein